MRPINLAKDPVLHLLVLALQVTLVLLNGRFLRRTFLSEVALPTIWERAAFDLALGFSVLALLFSVFGFLFYDVLLLTGLALPMAVLGARQISPRFPTLPQKFTDRWITALLIFFFTLTFLGTLSPEVRFDSLMYHLEVPRLWLNFGRIVEVPENGHSYFPYGFDVHYGWSLALGSDSAAKGLHWLAGLTATGLGAVIARRLGADPLHAAALFAFIPMQSFLATTTYIDLATGMYGLGAIVLLLGGIARPQSAALFGLLVGSAMATKYTAWPLLGIPFGIAAVIALRRRPAALAICGAATLLPLLPWTLRNIMLTGNPVAPLMVAYFGPESAIRTGLAGQFDGFAGNPTDGLLMAPVAYAIHLVDQKYALGLLGILVGIMLEAFPRSPAHRAAQRTILFLLLGCFMAESFFTRGHPDGRYAMTSHGMGAALAACVLQIVGRRAPLFAGLLITTSAAIAFTDYGRYQRELNERWMPILGEDARTAYLGNHGVIRSDFEAIEDHLTNENAGRVLGAAYPSRHRYWVWISGLRNDIVDHANGPHAEPPAIAKSLRGLGFTHLIGDANPGFTRESWRRFLLTLPNPLLFGAGTKQTQVWSFSTL